MKKQCLFLTLLILPFLMTSCGKSHESLLDSQITQMEKMTEVLNTITDKSSAEAAKPKIEAIQKKMDEIKLQMEKLEEPSAEEQTALKKKYGPRMEKASKELIKAMFKSKAIEGFGSIIQGIEKL